MADHDQRARIAPQHLLEEVERFEVEVVGRLVEHDEIGRFRERPRQHQPGVLSTGKRLDRRPRLLRPEKEILHVADDVPRLAADDHAVATAPRKGVGDRRLRIEAFPALVEGGDLEIGAELDAAAVGLECAGEEIDQRRLAGAVGADQRDPVAAFDPERQVADDRAVAIALGDALGFDHELARGGGLLRGERRVAGGRLARPSGRARRKS